MIFSQELDRDFTQRVLIENNTEYGLNCTYFYTSILYFYVFFVFNQAAGLAPSMEQIEMLSEQLPKASLLKLYVSQQDRPRNRICI